MADINKEFLLRARADLGQATRQLDQFNRELDQTDRGGERATRSVSPLSGAIRALIPAATAYLSLRTASEVLQQADAFNILDQRIRTATRATGDYNLVSRELRDIAADTGTALRDTVPLFQNLARTAPELRATSDQMLTLTRLVQQLGAISGASDSALSAGLLQFSQAMAAGTVRAEELNSIIENIPELANRIAKGMGLTTGELRKMVLEGRLLSRDVFQALLGQAGEIDEQFRELPNTLQRAGNRMSNSWGNLISRLDQAYGITQLIAKAMELASDTMDDIAAGIPVTPMEKAKASVESYERQVESARGKVEALRLAQEQVARITPGNLGRVAFDTRELDDAEAMVEALEKGLRKARFELEGIRQAERRAPEAQFGSGDSTPLVNEQTEEQARAEAAAQKLVDTLREQAETFGLTAEQIALYRLELAGATPEQLAAAKAHIEELSALREGQAARDRWLVQQREAAEIYEATRTEQEQLADEWERLDKLLAEGAISWDTYARAVFDAKEETSSFEAEIKTVKGAADGLGEGLIAAARGWGTEFTNTVVDVVTGAQKSFSDLVDAIIRDLLRVLVYQNLTQPIFAGLGINLGGTTTAATNHTGGIVGAPGPSRQVPAAVFAGAPRLHFGGLAGDEVPTILQRGEEVLTRADPRHRANLGAGGGSVRVEVVNKGTPQRAVSAEATVDAAGTIIRVVTEDLDRGGQLDQRLRARFKERDI